MLPGFQKPVRNDCPQTKSEITEPTESHGTGDGEGGDSYDKG
jgi:hypothetical protein